MFESFSEIAEFCANKKIDFYEAVLLMESKERETCKDEIISKMKTMWNAMVESYKSYDPELKSRSGLSGGNGALAEAWALSGSAISGPYISKVISVALKMGESNACMKRIVASPTAGSCGVIPAVLIPLFLEGKFSEDEIIKGLFVSAGIGSVIASRASIAGAEGGCQAEIGAASSMAAGTLVYLNGGSTEQIITAAGFALKNLLGLVCDPVAGLVEVPCVKRNVVGAVNAVSSADMALAGIKSKIPSDEIVDAMKRVGNMLHSDLKETGRGGLASCKLTLN